MNTAMKRFVVLETDPCVIRDRAEGINFQLSSEGSAENLCKLLTAMHNTIGSILEENDKLKLAAEGKTCATKESAATKEAGKKHG